MANYIIRRLKLGRRSCKGIRLASVHRLKTIRHDRGVPADAEWVFRWGCVAAIAAPEGKTVNRVEAINLVNNKARFREKLSAAELCPTTWLTADAAKYPCVVRPQFHAQGRRLFLCQNRAELEAAARRCGEGWYASEYIKKTAEYRVFVAQGRAVWAVRKIPGNPQDIAWNVFRGGRFENIKWDAWPLKIVKTAVEAFNLSGLDFGGVDVMEDAKGEAFVLEINSAPSQTSPYRQQCTAKVFDWIIQHGKAAIPLQKEKGGYLKFIHPAITADARIGA